MKNITIFIFFLGFNAILLCQPSYDAKRNYQWLAGYNYFLDDPDIEHVLFDYNQDSLILSYNKLAESVGFEGENTSICDKHGNLIFYSNGCSVQTYNGLIPGTEDMNEGFAHDLQCGYGYPVPQGMLTLPIVGPGSFYLFYQWEDYRENFGWAAFRLQSMRIVQDTISGQLMASDIDNVVLDDTLNAPLAACRHANGKDWWLIAPKSGSDKFFSMLITDNGVQVVNEQQLGESRVRPWDDFSGQCCFSPDGTRFVEYCVRSDLKLFDFDRCTGELSKPIHVPIQDYADTIFAAGACFSPNSRYLYVPSTNAIYQFDMQATDIPNSKQIVAVYDGVMEGFLALDFNHAELAPDGKIYINNFAGRTTYHVIEHPDSAGVACGVVQHAKWTDYAVSSFPHHPNYLLGPLEGSSCDTVSSVKVSAGAKMELRAYPNPARSEITLEVEGIAAAKGSPMEITVYNGIGLEVGRYYVAPYSPLVKVSTEGWQPGVYFAQLWSGDKMVSVEKIVVLH